jgi:hypothetical protein
MKRFFFRAYFYRVLDAFKFFFVQYESLSTFIFVHGTVLPGYFLRNFLQHFLQEERYAKLRYVNNFCSTL